MFGGRGSLNRSSEGALLPPNHRTYFATTLMLPSRRADELRCSLLSLGDAERKRQKSNASSLRSPLICPNHFVLRFRSVHRRPELFDVQSRDFASVSQEASGRSDFRIDFFPCLSCGIVLPCLCTCGGCFTPAQRGVNAEAASSDVASHFCSGVVCVVCLLSEAKPFCQRSHGGLCFFEDPR